MVLKVFGQNLRQLTAQRGSIAGVSAALDISRVQFQRFLKGEAFPKPQVLNRICTYFGVDARILLHPLSDARPAPAVQEGLAPELVEGLTWAIRGNRYPIKPDLMEPGLYRYWVADGHDADTYHCMPVQISARLGRGGPLLSEMLGWRTYFHRKAFRPHGAPQVPSRREVRGLVLGVPDGLIILAFNPAPILRITMMHLAPNPVFADGSFVGFTSWGRAEIVGYGRVARCYMERVVATPREVLACARLQTPMPGAKVPPDILRHIEPPVEQSRPR